MMEVGGNAGIRHYHNSALDFPIDINTQAPLVDESRVREILHEHYTEALRLPTSTSSGDNNNADDVQSLSITPLVGYDDLNFAVEVVEAKRGAPSLSGGAPTQTNSGVDNGAERRRDGRFVLKFTNPIEARVPEVLGK